MATSWRLITIVTALFCLGKIHVSANESLDEIRARLSSLEASQNTWRQSLDNLEQVHEQDAENMTQFCQGLKIRVDEQQEALKDIQESLGGEVEPDGEGEGEGEQDREGPCRPGNYFTIDDERRRIAGAYSGNDEICDRDMDPGWKRFMLNGKSAVIPIKCVAVNNCHTDAPTWVDLQGKSLPRVGQEVEARACSHWVNDCCNWEAPITVRNCGGYFVYNTRPLRVCHLAFCAEPK